MTQGVGDALSLAGTDVLDQATPAPPGPKAIRGRSPLSLAFDRLKRDRGAMLSLGIIILIALFAVFAPVVAHITGHPPNKQYRGLDALSALGQAHAPSSKFWFGTDDSGRDILVRIAYGARVSLTVGIGATLLTIVIGLIVGLIAGYYGGLVDGVLARIIDVVLSVPYLLFAIALVTVLGQINMWVVMVVIAFSGWASVARIIRGQVISMREREFVEAARSLGASNMRIIFIDILPNVIAPAIVFSTLLLPVSIVSEAALSYLGVGIPPPTADWGQMIAAAQNQYQIAWWYLFFPGLALLITTLAFNILGDGVRDAFDPRSDRIFAK
ncbi:MAG: peptide/nickel transport system permease protein [Frankiaceae bacterium]|jgi:peptide/nickel transport system permease protein|nr:peptide/nickel transport system permease protein [Frankiaceae bacterium]MDQ1725486.1 peptide/nickel transport system permease protein [Frankiaceae bacterium]